MERVTTCHGKISLILLNKTIELIVDMSFT
jgi:hypothetical protein